VTSLVHVQAEREAELYGRPVEERWTFSFKDGEPVEAAVDVRQSEGSKRIHRERDVDVAKVPAGVREQAEALLADALARHRKEVLAE